MGRQQASKIYKTKRYTRDTDQILSNDLKSKASIHALQNQKFDEYLPGLGKHYCVPCAKYYESDVALTTHRRSKIHKRQLKNIKFGPYTPEEAAAGAGRDVEKHLRKQQEYADMLKSEDARAELHPDLGQTHKKKHQGEANAEMDIEGESAPVESKETSPPEEITV